jgi:hypothetical protein
VYFLDTLAPSDPFGRAVLRPVSATLGDPEQILTQLFLGPTTDEAANGLRLITSGATGFTNFTYPDVNGVVTVKLTGGCSRGTETYTIADMIIANLKNLSGITAVKVYGPDGTTQTPTGVSDSIPACLAP